MGNSRKGTQRKQVREKQAGSGGRRLYEWDSSVLRTVADILLFVAIGVMLVIVFFAMKTESMTLRNVLLGVVLACFGCMEYVRAADNKQKGGPKKTTTMLIVFGSFLTLCGVAVVVFLEIL